MTGWARGPESPKLYGHHIMYSVSRTLLECMPVHVGQYVEAPHSHPTTILLRVSLSVTDAITEHSRVRLATNINC